MNAAVHGRCMPARDDRGMEETPIFDGRAAARGYALNKMCFSFNSRACREAFRSDPEAYMTEFGLSEQQKRAVRRLSVAELIAAGGNIYYLAKLAGIYGLGVQDIGAQQTGMSLPEFKAMLLGAAS